MKNLLIILIVFVTSMCTISCKKEIIEIEKIGDFTESLADTISYFRYQEKTFISGTKTVTGTVTMFGNTNVGTPDTLMFVFRNFNLDADAENVNVRAVTDTLAPNANFTSLGSLKGKSGNFLYKKVNSPLLYSSGFLILYNTNTNERYGHVAWSF